MDWGLTMWIVNSGLCVVDCGMRIDGCGLWIADWELRIDDVGCRCGLGVGGCRL